MRGLFALCILPAALARPLEIEATTITVTAPITTAPAPTGYGTGTGTASYSFYSSYPHYRNGSCFTNSSYLPLPTGTGAPCPTASAGFHHHAAHDSQHEAWQVPEGHMKRFEGARKHADRGPWLPYEPARVQHHPHHRPHPRPTGTDTYPTGTGAFPTGTGVHPTGTGVYPTGTGVYPTGTGFYDAPLPTNFLDGLRREARWLM